LRFKAFAALLVLVVVAAAFPAALGKRGSRYIYVFTYTLENRGDEPHVLSEDDATIPLFQNNSWQTVTVRSATYAVARRYVDDDGNRLAVLDLSSELAPHSSLNFSITYEMESADRPEPEIDPAEAGPMSDIPRGLVEEFGVETETFTSGDEAIQALALRLAANQTTVLGAVTSILEWFIENVSYSTFEVPRYPNETLARGRGDCDDQAILLIALCRALDIPALLQVGVVFNENIASEKSSWGGHLRVEQRGVGWHGWALVYIPPWGWLPIEMTYTKSQDPLSRITGAAVYKGYTVVSFNVSRQAYIGDSRRSRERLMSSDVYITMSDGGIEGSSGNRSTSLYVIVGVSVGLAAVAAAIFLRRRRSRRTGFNSKHHDYYLEM